MARNTNYKCANGRTHHRSKETQERCPLCRASKARKERLGIGIPSATVTDLRAEGDKAAATIDALSLELDERYIPKDAGYPGGVFKAFDWENRKIRDCDIMYPWREEEIEDARRVETIANLTAGDYTEMDREQALDILYNMENPVLPYRPYSSNNLPQYKERGKHLHSMAMHIIAAAEYDPEKSRTAPTRERNPHLIGADAALERYRMNNFYFRDTDTNILNRAIDDRVANGDMEDVNNTEETGFDLKANGAYHFSTYDACRYNLRDEEYLALVFPDKELKDAMGRANLDGVSVSTFNNARENGMVYTVNSPDGNTRSFCVYEHRSTDSIILNGKENWSGDDRPCFGDDSNSFFAEFNPEDKVAAADTLTFLLKEAQNGELPDDATLAREAPRRDWDAIMGNIFGDAWWEFRTRDL